MRDLSTFLRLLGRSGVSQLTTAMAAFVLTLGLCLYGFGSRRYFRRFIGLGSARELGMYRAAICLAVLLQTLSEPLPNLSEVPREILRPVGIMRARWPFVDTALAKSSVFLVHRHLEAPRIRVFTTQHAPVLVS